MQIIAGTSVLVLVTGNRYTYIIPVTAGHTFQHRDSKNHIVIIRRRPIAFIVPKFFVTLFQIMLVFLDYFTQIGDSDIIIMLEIVTTFHISHVVRILFIGT